MLAFRVMEALRRGHGAGFLAFCAAFIAFQCGREEFDLLSAGQAAGTAGSQGGGGFSGQPPAGTGGWSEPSNPPCLEGLPCWCTDDEDCEFSMDTPFCTGSRCVACRSFFNGEQMGCEFGEKCDRSFCRQACRGGNDDCAHDLFCDVDLQRYTCVECSEKKGCENDRGRDHCLDGQCVECLYNGHCPRDEACWYGTCFEVP
jgi:hypothetical protein